MKHLRILLNFGIIITLILISFELSLALNPTIQACSIIASTIKPSTPPTTIAKPTSYSINGTFIDYNRGARILMTQNKSISSDSSDNQNKIDTWENSYGEIVLRLKLMDKNQRIKISIWNMLGKVVIEDFEGNYKDLDPEHIIKNSNSLNRGAYLIRVQGEKSKIDAKFIKSR